MSWHETQGSAQAEAPSTAEAAVEPDWLARVLKRCRTDADRAFVSQVCAEAEFSPHDPLWACALVVVIAVQMRTADLEGVLARLTTLLAKIDALPSRKQPASPPPRSWGSIAANSLAAAFAAIVMYSLGAAHASVAHLWVALNHIPPGPMVLVAILGCAIALAATIGNKGSAYRKF